jgi:hypothetical protein
MLTLSSAEKVLDEYVERVVPAMLRCQYHLTLVKGGPEYSHLPEQSHFAHIVNGIFGLAQLVKFLITRSVFVPGLDETMFRKALALYTVHEVHKDHRVEFLGSSQFSIPLERLREEYDRLGLDSFAEVDEHLMRAANVHKRSTKHGDLLVSEEAGAAHLWLLVRLADTFASVKIPEEAVASLRGYLSDLGPAFAAKSPPGKYALCYHEVKDIRGVLTNIIHQAIARLLEVELGFYPLLHFSTGTLYIGPIQRQEIVHERFIQDVAVKVLGSLTEGGNTDAARDGLRHQKFDFERYVYAFSSVETLLEVVRDETAASKPNARIALREIDNLVAKRQELTTEWRETVEQRFGISLLDPRVYKTFNELWSLVRRYLLYVDTLLRDLNPAENRLEWFLHAFPVPQPAADNLRQEADIWARGGVGKYVLVVAYHFLHGPDFADRSAEALPIEEALTRLHRRVLRAMQQVDTQTGRQAAVAELGLRQDLEAYLSEHLSLSFAPTSHLTTDGLESYVAPKRKGHTGEVCSLCNRRTEYIRPLRAGILDDFGRVFSNRVLPALEAPQGNRLWCPVCHLEFILRKLMGMGLPPDAHYKNSRRIYIYVLPTFSFTPEHIRLFHPLLEPFHRVTALPVRDYGRDWGLPHYWLEHRSFDRDWNERLQEVLAREVDKIADWGGRRFVGERTSLGHITGQPHYYLITWEKAARDAEPDDARIATRTEAWAKAMFAAVVISGLTSCKVYVTERAYLPVADPAELKATVTLDSPPPALRGLLGGRTDVISLYGRERDRRSGVELVLDLSAALWTVTADVRAPKRQTKDKRIAGRLGMLNASPLAGATFYKEFGRLNEGQSPYPSLATACDVLLDVQAETQGGELMDLVERIAQKSLEIALPLGTSGRGKARRYELVFREAVSAMRKARKIIPEMRQAAIGGRRPSEQSIAELKRLAAGTLLKGLERRQDTRRGEVFVRAWGDELGRLAGQFLDILVDDLYLGRAGGSFARFLRLENALADGIYYYTDRNLSRLWREYKQQRSARAEEAAPQIEQQEESQ